LVSEASRGDFKSSLTQLPGPCRWLQISNDSMRAEAGAIPGSAGLARFQPTLAGSAQFWRITRCRWTSSVCRLGQWHRCL